MTRQNVLNLGWKVFIHPPSSKKHYTIRLPLFFSFFSDFFNEKKLWRLRKDTEKFFAVKAKTFPYGYEIMKENSGTMWFIKLSTEIKQISDKWNNLLLLLIQ